MLAGRAEHDRDASRSFWLRAGHIGVMSGPLRRTADSGAPRSVNMSESVTPGSLESRASQDWVSLTTRDPGSYSRPTLPTLTEGCLESLA